MSFFNFIQIYNKFVKVKLIFIYLYEIITISNMEQGKKEMPSKEQVLAFYKEQIEVNSVRRDLAKINAEIARHEFKRFEYTVALAQLSSNSKKADNVQQHVVTEEDLENNPELASNGVKVGDTINIAVEPEKNDLNK